MCERVCVSDFCDLIVMILFERLVLRIRVCCVGVAVVIRFIVADVRRHRGRRAACVTVRSFLYRLGKIQFHLKQTIKTIRVYLLDVHQRGTSGQMTRRTPLVKGFGDRNYFPWTHSVSAESRPFEKSLEQTWWFTEALGRRSNSTMYEEKVSNSRPILIRYSCNSKMLKGKTL